MLFLSDFDCNSSYVYEGETANIGCNLNTTSFFSINVTRLNSTIASILADGSVIVYSEYQGKLTAVLSLASLRLIITLSSVKCSDSDTYTSKMYLHSGNDPFTTFKIVMKGQTLYFFIEQCVWLGLIFFLYEIVLLKIFQINCTNYLFTIMFCMFFNS